MSSSGYQYEKIKSLLLNDIREMPAGTKLFSRPDLAKRYSVSRTTIDRAISELIGEGYIFAMDGSGTYVSNLSKQLGIDKSSDNYESWGFIVPDIRTDTYPGILRGVEDIANENDINIIICNSDNDQKKCRES